MADVDVDVPSVAPVIGAAMDIDTAVLAILAESFEEHQIPLIRVDSHKKLGEWSGLCKIEKEGSVVVIKDFAGEAPSLNVVKEHLRQNS